MGRHALPDGGHFRSLMDGAIDLAGRDRLDSAATGKQPAMGRHDVPPLALAPPETKQLQELRRQHRVAVLAPLTLFHPDQHAGAVDVVDLEGGDFRDPKPGAVGGPERGFVLETRRRLEQSPDLLDAQHVRKLAGMTDQDEASGQIRPVERHGEEEAERRHRTVDSGGLHPALGLMNLETTDILGGRRIRRPPEEGGEAPHEAYVVVLRVLSKAAYRHVLKHALTERAHGLLDSWFEHRVLPLELKVTLHARSPTRTRSTSHGLIAVYGCPLPRPQTPLPRSGFVHGRKATITDSRFSELLRNQNLIVLTVVLH